jgi:oligopeptide transport system permease protein
MSQPSMEKGRSLSADALARLRKNRTAVVCGWLFLTVVMLCFIGPLFCSWTPGQVDPALKMATAPSAAHWLGTDLLGRDVLVRVLTGGQVSLLVGIVATLVSIVIGVTWGAVAGYYGGKVDAVLMRTVDVLYGLPFIVLVILFRLMLDPTGLAAATGLPLEKVKLVILIFTIGILEWLTMARIVRGQVQSLANLEFVEAAKCLGLSTPVILFRHIIPNTLSHVIVYTTLTIPAVMLLEAALSFLGLGVEPPQSSWGLMIKEGAQCMETYWWMLLFPSLFFGISLFCLNFLGDGLRNALDVRAAKD